MTNFRELLNERKILITDGAWGTQLTGLGLPLGVLNESWNLDHPEKVREVAASYVDTGCDVILTNTLGGSRIKLEKGALADKTVEINRAGVEISRSAAGDKALVFASVGPTGEFLAPLGTVSEAEMVECFAEQVKAFVDAGADGIVIETQIDLAEAKAALRSAKENSTLPVVVSMTFDKGARGFATMMGVKPDQAAGELDQAGADIIGTNCSSGIDDMIEVVRLMKPHTDKPVWAKPNAGMPELVNGATVFRETPEQMASKFSALVEAGASLIGGCCGTTPEHIRLFVEAVQQYRA